MSILHIIRSHRGEPLPDMTKEQHAAFQQGVQAARLGMEPQCSWTQEQRAGWLCHTSVMRTLTEVQPCAN